MYIRHPEQAHFCAVVKDPAMLKALVVPMERLDSSPFIIFRAQNDDGKANEQMRMSRK